MALESVFAVGGMRYHHDGNDTRHALDHCGNLHRLTCRRGLALLRVQRICKVVELESFSYDEAAK